MGTISSKTETPEENGRYSRQVQGESSPANRPAEVEHESQGVKEEIVGQKQVTANYAIFGPGAFPGKCPDGYARDRNGKCRPIS